jgi:hypothetical protein
MWMLTSPTLGNIERNAKGLSTINRKISMDASVGKKQYCPAKAKDQIAKGIRKKHIGAANRFVKIVPCAWPVAARAPSLKR